MKSNEVGLFAAALGGIVAFATRRAPMNIKRALTSVAVASSFCAYAGILGVLVKTEPTTSVTGKLVYRCTYSVAGQYTTVILDRFCPPTMQFE